MADVDESQTPKFIFEIMGAVLAITSQEWDL